MMRHTLCGLAGPKDPFGLRKLGAEFLWGRRATTRTQLTDTVAGAGAAAAARFAAISQLNAHALTTSKEQLPGGIKTIFVIDKKKGVS